MQQQYKLTSSSSTYDDDVDDVDADGGDVEDVPKLNEVTQNLYAECVLCYLLPCIQIHRQ